MIQTLAAVLVLTIVGCGLPPDERLIQEFPEHRPQLEALLHTMLTSDRANLLNDSHHLRDGFRANNIPEEEAEAYLQSLRAAGVLEIRNWHKYGRNLPVCFITARSGWPIETETKGYAWFPGPPMLLRTVVSSLNGWKREDGEAYRRFDDEWYVFYAPS